MHKEGWHGQITKGKRRGTSNVGFIHGGGATNVVTDRVQLKAEARSHDPKFRKQIVEAIERAFRDAVKQVRSATGQRGAVTIDGRLDYESFRLADDEACIVAAEAAPEQFWPQTISRHLRRRLGRQLDERAAFPRSRWAADRSIRTRSPSGWKSPTFIRLVGPRCDWRLRRKQLADGT